jgi:hypothetical protein
MLNWSSEQVAARLESDERRAAQTKEADEADSTVDSPYVEVEKEPPKYDP